MESIPIYLYRFVFPIVIGVGTIGCILNLIVFTQKTLRKNPCSIYMIAYNLSNLIYIYWSILFLTLSVGYNLNINTYNSVLCRLSLYFNVLLNFLSSCYLILAAIDRIFITSRNVSTRQRSTRRFAYLSIILITIFWIISLSHLLILSNIIEIFPDFFVCRPQLGVYIDVLNGITLVKEILTPSLLIVLGLWSIKNIRKTERATLVPNLSVSRTNPMGNIRAHVSKDRQLMFMLLIDISIHIFFSVIYVSFVIYMQITQYYIKSTDQIEIEHFVQNLCLFGISIPFCTSCYTSLIVSKTFRNEMKKIFIQIRHWCIH